MIALTVVVDHDTGRLVWAAAGRDRKTVERFLDELGEERCKQLELVSADMAAWVAGPISERRPQAELCLDPFHIVMLATDALDEIRREVCNEARRAGDIVFAKDLKGARFALSGTSTRPCLRLRRARARRCRDCRGRHGPCADEAR